MPGQDSVAVWRWMLAASKELVEELQVCLQEVSWAVRGSALVVEESGTALFSQVWEADIVEEVYTQEPAGAAARCIAEIVVPEAAVLALFQASYL